MLPRTFDLNLLRVFDSLMTTQSVTASSRQLNLTQPSTSNALERLRDALGDPVLVRDGRKMAPTRYARDLWPFVQSALGELDAGFAHLEHFDPLTMTGPLRIGLDPYAMAAFGPALALALLNAAPKLDISLVPAPSNINLNGFEDLDFAISAMWTPEIGLKVEAIKTEPFQVVMREDHPILSLPSTQRLRAYVEAKHVLLSEQGVVNGNVDTALKSLGLQRRVVLAFPDFTAVASVLEQTDMVSTLGCSLAQRTERIYSVCTIQPPLDVPEFGVSIVSRKRDVRSGMLNWAQDICRRVLADPP